MSSEEFDRAKKTCLKNGTFYEDPDFPIIQSSVFYHQVPPFPFTWRRPGEFCKDPLFLDEAEEATCFDLSPGNLGDRWLLSCMGSISCTKGLFYRVVPADQSFQEDEYAGIFRFRIWWHGEWKEVIVDDRLPTVNGKLVFIQSLHGNIFWGPLLEKAYAKLHGSYEALKYGSAIEGLSDLTGGIAETINLNQELGTLPLLQKLLSMTSVVTSLVRNEGETSPLNPKHSYHERLPNGIILYLNYRVMSLHRIGTLEGESIQLIKLRNPLGFSSEYVGTWGRDASDWRRMGKEDRSKLSGGLLEGEFFMSYNDFVKTFTCLQVVHLDVETSRDEPSLRGKSPWLIRLWKGIWRKGVTAGGCRNHYETFHLNPQLLITVNNTDEFVISLSQHSVLDAKVIGFSIYPSAGGDQKMDRSLFKRSKSLFNSAYTNSKAITQRCRLEEGSYLLFPTTYEPGQEGMFTIRIYSGRGPIKLRHLDTIPLLTKSAIVKAPSTFDAKFAHFEAMFSQLADEHKTINAFELQELLENCLPNDFVKSCATLDVCRQMVSVMDSKGFGRIEFGDYKNLMCSIKLWQNTFKGQSKGTAGILRGEKLKEALQEIGFQLNNDILFLIVLRYMRKDGTLRFGDFVSVILHLSISFNLFTKKDPINSGTIRMSLTEWLKSSLLA